MSGSVPGIGKLWIDVVKRHVPITSEQEITASHSHCALQMDVAIACAMMMETFAILGQIHWPFIINGLDPTSELD